MGLAAAGGSSAVAGAGLSAAGSFVVVGLSFDAGRFAASLLTAGSSMKDELMPGDSVIQKSRQVWKIVAGWIGVFAGGIALVGGIQGEGNPTIAIGGILLGLGSFVAMCLSIRCHRCGARWLWMAVSQQKHLHWWNWLVAQTVCSKCGDDPAVSSSKPLRAP
jgi:hypothetical protein